MGANSWIEGAPKPAHDALLVRLGNNPVPVAAAPHGDHHGEGAAVAAEPLTPASAGSVATTLTALLIVAAALAARVGALARHQRRRFVEMSEMVVAGPADSHFDNFAENAHDGRCARVTLSGCRGGRSARVRRSLPAA